MGRGNILLPRWSWIERKALLHLGGLACLSRLSRVSSLAADFVCFVSHYCHHHRGFCMVSFAVTKGFWLNASVFWSLVCSVLDIGGLVIRNDNMRLPFFLVAIFRVSVYLYSVVAGRSHQYNIIAAAQNLPFLLSPTGISPYV